MNSSNNLTRNVNYVQTEWYCDKCKANHFGNCPKMKVTLTTTSNNLTPEQKIDEILGDLKYAHQNASGENWWIEIDNAHFEAKQQLLSLIQEEKKLSWEDGYQKGWRARNDNQKKTRRSVSGNCLASTEVDKSIIPQDRLQALKQESKK